MDNRILVHYRTATEYKTTIKINKSKNNIKKSYVWLKVYVM